MFGFGGTWIKAEGVVVASREVSRSVNVSIREFVVEVRPEGEAAFRAEVPEPRIATNFWKPNDGESVGVEYEAKTRKVRFDKSDPRTSAKARRRALKDAEERRFKDKLNGG